MEKIIRIAVQKSGRLSDDSLSLIKECGIKFYNGTGKLKSTSTNFPIEFLFLRDDDIPGYVSDGVADLGIVGENELVEKDKDVTTLKKLGFSKCRLSLAIPKGQEYSGIEYFQGKNIATSYPKILGDYLESKKIQASIHEISGSVEIAPSIGLAEGICDIVSSGSTLMMNGLKEVEEIFRSEAVLIANKDLEESKKQIVDKLLFRMNAVQKGKSNKYVLLNAPNESLEKIVSLIPGMRSPTILPLAQEGWSSVHSVLNEDQFWENIEELRAAGAEGILVVPIEKMVI
ncbi:MAG TPA: ATP phosphoribosyltransferase [Algoriphagus sp.]|jgi:ATP phosphoribosyltransferase|uniref:ATP phosphoribosyltransferase n=1 Tax=unclassified Algoriphagus TaxID=2641541 RepID=UPI000C5C1BAD|nr:MULTISPECIES: ATP phosphoribosyltransferase [unclassified Algoriphagus]MAL11868.1 ATP phosphoribosyltransferase [Algoriphagus sp.]MAN86545.1 ATP phosphoribosyltransferase [Algoriphagus sp.]QYH38711.1 ATP phosphoribosyltransferase [Algoriphagus sp. NBT04N3]HAD52442.1 ATP phosphoribosyltransferase [Algoriphagus sp.]HAH35606.1 ATP phosphoribosyltransferase [Algoriphagus sp.]|tara:strand:+ start:11964 stop:12824 length:861 start_codon:yes stop_codon:yes gene_type:complete